MSEGLFVVDRNYQILSYNKSAMQIFGMDPRQEHENLLAVNRSEGFRNAVDSALKGHHAQENLELNGRVYQIIANAVCQPDFAEDMVGAVILVLDVTEKEAQEQYRREFTANVSHELKTPLTVIMTNAELLESPDYPPEAKTQFSSNILTMSHQMRGLVESLLNLARIDQGQKAAAHMPVDLSKLVSDATLPSRSCSSSRSCRFRPTSPPF